MRQVEAIKFKNRDAAEAAVCEAYVKLGELAGIDPAAGIGPTDLAKDLASALQQSYYGDPHFLGGPCCFNYAKTQADVEKIEARGQIVITGLLQYIDLQNVPDKNVQAEAQVKKLETAFAWLKKTVRSP